MIIEVGTDRYKDLFGSRDYSARFESKLPSYNVLLTALRDPSLKSDAIDQVLQATGSAGSLYSAAMADLQLGSQVLTYMRVAASRIGPNLTLPGNGMLTSMSEGLAMTMQSFKVPTRMDSNQIQALLADAAFSAGLQGLGAIGPIGKIAAAIIGAAKMIIQMVQQNARNQAAQAEHNEKQIYLTLPPLQQPDTEVDSYYVESVLRPIMETGAWTRLFSPRFESDLWVGIERNGGIAFAPGEEIDGKDAFGRDNKVFKPGPGVGLIPGLDRVTSVVQVGLDPIPLKKWDGSGRWPVKPSMVTDVGKFYVNTGRLASIAWGWATAYDACPDLYKIDVGVHNGPGDKHLHHRWKRYCDGGVRFMQETSDAWLKNGTGAYSVDDIAKRILGSGIGCAVAGWQCMNTLEGGKYERVTPGWIGDQMSKYGLGKGTLGCVMDPPSMQVADQNGGQCVLTLYDVYIRNVLEKVRARQIHYLWHSLVAAYVRADFDAFRDPKMKSELMRARKVLLEHPDRKLVELNDVADDEPGLPGSGKTWKQQLIARGVRPPHPFQHGGRIRTSGAQPGTLKPDKEPPPKVPVSRFPMPFGERVEGGGGDADGDADPTPGKSRTLLWAAGGTALVSGGAALAYYLKKKRDDRRT